MKKRRFGLKRSDDTPTKVWPAELLDECLSSGGVMTTEHDKKGCFFYCVPCMNHKGKDNAKMNMRCPFNLSCRKEHKNTKSHVDAVKILVAEEEKKKREAVKRGTAPEKLQTQQSMQSYFAVRRKLKLRGVTPIPQPMSIRGETEVQLEPRSPPLPPLDSASL